MGLYLSAKGFNGGISIGYVKFGLYRMALAHEYNQTFGEIYCKWYMAALGADLYPSLIDEDLLLWGKIGNDNLDVFLTHSDCSGKMTVQECIKTYKILKNIEFNNENFKYLHKRILLILEHCKRKRVVLWFY